MTEGDDVVNQWKEWNTQGFIPGPEESERAFQERVTFCLDIENQLGHSIGSGTELPFESSHPISKEVVEQALPLTQHLYGIQPQWVPLFFGNYQLAPWHGGCAWIFQLNEETPTSAFLQLRTPFRDSPQFLKIYHRRELIAHELAHVGRMLYQEPQFEEFFAYQTSPSPWRRWLGPIIQSSKESFVFIFLLAIVVMADFALFSLGPKMEAFALWIKLLPVALVIFALGRLIYRHRILKRCSKNLEDFFPSLPAQHLLYRLRDSEIKLFSKFSKEKIEKFIEKASRDTFRWRFLQALYF